MTWHLGARLGALLGVFTALVAAGCGSDSEKASITITDPEESAELTVADDRDPDEPGVQYDVSATSKRLRAGTVVLLQIEGELDAFSTKVDEDGEILFDNVTLPPGAHTLTVLNASGTVTSEEVSYTLKTLVIESPREGEGIAFGDDTEKDEDGLQINVRVKAYAVEGEEISLKVDNETVGDSLTPNDEGVVTFRKVTLSNGAHTLKAVAGDIESGETKVTVNEQCASVTFMEPELPETGDRVQLGGGDECPAEGNFTTSVVISTDAGDGRDVSLSVNGLPVMTTKVDGLVARFDNVVLNRRTTANELSVTVQGADGNTCVPEVFPAGIFVDCEGSDCSIGSPVPYAGQNATGDSTLYLNKSAQNGNGFDIRVDSDTGILGKKVELIIDGRDGSSALMEDPEPAGSKVSATFERVRLSEGERTIEARCTDGAGNVTRSGEVKWFVDTVACDITLDEPAADTTFYAEDDADTGAGGLQAEVKYTIDGDGCTGHRAASCNPENGIPGSDFADYSSSPVTTNVTLADEAEQTLCAEVRDRANNIAIASVEVTNGVDVVDMPELTITSPAEGSMLGPDASCVPAAPNADRFGVEFELTIDKTENRVLTYTVGSGSANPIPISGTTVTYCVPVAEGANAISFALDSSITSGVDNETRNITAQGIRFTAPANTDPLTVSANCAGGGFTYQFVAAVAAPYNGKTVTFSVGSMMATGVAAAGQASACLLLPQGPSTVTASVADSDATAEINVTAVSDAPLNAIPITTIDLPAAGAGYRGGAVTLNWATPTETFPGELVAYEIKCANVPVEPADDAVARLGWWTSLSEVVTPTTPVTPPATGASVTFRIGEERHCAIRGRNAANLLTPIPDTVAANYEFRRQAVDVAGGDGRAGATITNVGDVNGDGATDILLGGLDRAYLYFGGTTLGTAPNVTFIGEEHYDDGTINEAFDGFATRTAAIGDYNNDGRNDFAIGYPGFSADTPLARGRVYVFYGRAPGDDWPASLDMSSPAACQADLCFTGEQDFERFGRGLSPVGDFDGDGEFDFAVGSPDRDGETGRLYILLGNVYETGARTGAFYNIDVPVQTSGVGFYVAGMGTPGPGTTTHLGSGIAPLGNIDGSTGDELAVSAPGTTPTVDGKVFRLAGRAHTAGMVQILSDDPGLTLIDSGLAGRFGLRLASFRNFANTGAQTGIPDLGVFVSALDEFFVYLGDDNGSGTRFAVDTRINVFGPSGTLFSNGGLGSSSTFNPNLGNSVVGDLDGDGLDDIAVAMQQASGMPGVAGPAYLFYGDVVRNRVTTDSTRRITSNYASRLDFPARPNTGERTVQYIGDINGDTLLDLAIGEPDGNGGAGGITLLY